LYKNSNILGQEVYESTSGIGIVLCRVYGNAENSY